MMSNNGCEQDLPEKMQPELRITWLPLEAEEVCDNNGCFALPAA